MWGDWVFAALFFPALQILPLYLWPGLPRSQTIYRRIAATTAAAGAAAWVPTARRLAAVAAAGGSSKAPVASSALLAALGLRVPGLAAACALPLALTALLFSGPLLMLALGWLSCGGSSSSSSQAPRPRPAASLSRRAVMLRNWVAAPLIEEFIFRACLISFLLAAGASPARCIWLSPLLFAASHLHHFHDLVRFQGAAPAAATRALAFQLSYTTVFGWLAAFFFVRTRHLAAAVLPHAFCNLMGPPVPPPPGSRHRGAIAAAFAGGSVAFFCLLGPLTSPSLYALH